MSEGPVITKKQFIAGAVCPACSEPDKLKMWTEDNVPHRECVACGYTDTLNDQGPAIRVPNSTTLRPERGLVASGMWNPCPGASEYSLLT